MTETLHRLCRILCAYILLDLRRNNTFRIHVESDEEFDEVEEEIMKLVEIVEKECKHFLGDGENG